MNRELDVGVGYLNGRLRRFCELFIALLAFILLSPIFLVVWVLLFNSKGGAIYCHDRVGRAGVKIRVPKFRSMHPDADVILSEYIDGNLDAKEEWLKSQKLINDPRVTTLGAYLRRFSLDELPQLLSVIKGDMSLVGPRPVTQQELNRYGRSKRYYLSTRPGITGAWQVSGRNSTTYQRRVAWDRYFVSNASVAFDIKILLRTVHVLLIKPNGI